VEVGCHGTLPFFSRDGCATSITDVWNVIIFRGSLSANVPSAWSGATGPEAALLDENEDPSYPWQHFCFHGKTDFTKTKLQAGDESSSPSPLRPPLPGSLLGLPEEIEAPSRILLGEVRRVYCLHVFSRLFFFPPLKNILVRPPLSDFLVAPDNYFNLFDSSYVSGN